MTDDQDKTVQTKRRRTARKFPPLSFEEAFGFAKQVYEFGAGQPVRRLTLFDDIGRSPESSASRKIITAAGQYGLTKGGYASETLELTPDGIKATRESGSPREATRAKIQLAILGVPAFKGLYEKFCGNKLPAIAALIDAVKDFDISNDTAEEAVDTFIVNTRYVGLLQTLSGAERIVTEDHLLDALPQIQHRELDQTVNPKEQSFSPLITTQDAEFETTAFYVTPIGSDDSEQRKHSDLFLESIVRPALEKASLNVVRADEIEKAGAITKQIIEYLLRARLVIVDLSFHNPNVFYELAIRHMVRKPVVQIIRSADRLPFDVNQMRTIQIDTTDIYSLVPQLQIHQAEIATQVRNALEDPDSVDNPVSIHFPKLQISGL